jgi:predicted ABC-type exoprotein transport system permease subunit
MNTKLLVLIFALMFLGPIVIVIAMEQDSLVLGLTGAALLLSCFYFATRLKETEA